MRVVYFALFVLAFVVITIVVLDPQSAPAVAAVLAAVASFVLALRAARGPSPATRDAGQKRRPSRGKRATPRWIIVDGSNVLYWNPVGPSLATVSDVLRLLESQGFQPVIWFDANVGYKVGGDWMGPWELSKVLNLPQKQILVAAKGQPADPLVLAEARKRRASVVSNDRFRDWAEDHPEVTRPGFLIRGTHGPEGAALKDLALVPQQAA
ncbi:NYN domain-containing protein [Pseudogemmobacter blasticus]|uniref:RNase NYN domain-containing protein n=1 Tax=Fuscovulum blasticum DSM 2131 TaxID=1188250 RepID=A0A2T4J5I0_FUSBL|nr:hypothetical protein [Fuscovulum blasticum]AWD22336.1 hypothetical protein B6K69_12160 [Fuscovulum blasticum]PTE13098.1 hypothetical protein C5F44_15300 [Fuscovulum blasticum DSM 2131]